MIAEVFARSIFCGGVTAMFFLYGIGALLLTIVIVVALAIGLAQDRL